LSRRDRAFAPLICSLLDQRFLNLDARLGSKKMRGEAAAGWA
jgi:hypothetical protein